MVAFYGGGPPKKEARRGLFKSDGQAFEKSMKVRAPSHVVIGVFFFLTQ